MSLTYREAGIPQRETHQVDVVRMVRVIRDGGSSLLPTVVKYRCPPHRSRWGLIDHRGDNCLWAKVRLPRSPRTRKDLEDRLAAYMFYFGREALA